ncbi:uncharacterized protein BDR25DRAFT_386472 [Lindgomyces ingoldianus]|uniref:Uncharacterized protein n=1 Tax=Lindgomyces ingoldianus TaxID=673940 RepID=A0ACB6R392_9PLEO|nr:uncharacterized protein BDR25DRAFT_386472 [Lindgomyces ingoldianus]KAF2473641.1 hypothetical protein BDR25DRAFT_386472 [Lindgomyces ingoldianus]
MDPKRCPTIVAVVFLLSFSATARDLRQAQPQNNHTEIPRRSLVGCKNTAAELYPLVGHSRSNSSQNNWMDGAEPPICMEEKAEEACKAFSTRWFDSVLDTKKLSSEIKANLSLGDTDLVLDRSKFCTASFTDIHNSCESSCSELEENNDLLQWVNRTCTRYCGFGMPVDWKNSLAITKIKDDKNDSTVQSFFWPTCLDASPWMSFLNSAVTNCTRNWIPGCPGSAFGCYTSFGIDMECLCRPPGMNQNLFDPRQLVLRDNSIGPWERSALGDWVQATCEHYGGSDILSTEWKEQLGIQYFNVTPFRWELRPGTQKTDLCSGSYYTVPKPGYQCPSASKKLGAFAINNVIVALLVPLFGRRTVLKKITCSFFGNPHSRGFLFTAPIMIILNIASNLINAVLVRRVPGYSDTNTRELFLLWCSRPRFAWSIILALPFQAEKQMYFSCVASTLATEFGLQVLGAYTMGRVVDYGRKTHKVYTNTKAFQGFPFRDAALLMYRGPLVWLIFAVVGFLPLLWSVAGINDRISTISQLRPKRKARSGKKSCTKAVSAVKLKMTDTDLSTNFPQLHCTSVQTIANQWSSLAKEWEQLHGYLNRHSLALRAASRQNDRMRRRQHESSEMYIRAVVAENAESTLTESANSIPTARERKAQENAAAVKICASSICLQLNQIERRWENASRELGEWTKQLAFLDCEIEFLIEQAQAHAQSSSLMQQLPRDFPRYQKEAMGRAPLIRSLGNDEAWRIQQLQEDRPSDYAAIVQDISHLVGDCGQENTSGGIASRWRRRFCTKR